MRETIPIIDQCTLCDNLKLNFQTGAVCALTDKKPVFEYQCSKFLFGETAENLLTEASSNVFLLESHKSKKQIQGLGYVILGSLVLIGISLFTIQLWEFGWMTSLSATVFALGLSFLAFGIRTPIQHKKNTNRAKAKLKKLDMVAQFYKKQYTIEHQAIDVHGELEIRSEFKHRNKL